MAEAYQLGMASKLFRAVVGLGISLGAASTACFGTVESMPDATEPTTGSEASAPETGLATNSSPSTDAGTDAPAVDAAADAPLDAPLDAPTDALLDAFCDASWPTTKGSGPTCGAIDGCNDAGRPPYCIEHVNPPSQTCGTGQLFPAWCVNGAWQCSTGGIREDECKCWVGQDCQ